MEWKEKEYLGCLFGGCLVVIDVGAFANVAMLTCRCDGCKDARTRVFVIVDIV